MTLIACCELLVPSLLLSRVSQNDGCREQICHICQPTSAGKPQAAGGMRTALALPRWMSQTFRPFSVSPSNGKLGISPISIEMIKMMRSFWNLPWKNTFPCKFWSWKMGRTCTTVRWFTNCSWSLSGAIPRCKSSSVIMSQYDTWLHLEPLNN